MHPLLIDQVANARLADLRAEAEHRRATRDANPGPSRRFWHRPRPGPPSRTVYAIPRPVEPIDAPAATPRPAA